ncbi:ParB/RepB/Spo0J family partition protein [Streptomyces aidingensis]|uniref:Chromosome partitioning protein, ParB family n=1 Tax=Streptomyces aidingensis TaxID=910347 RepID=A0A1I1UTH7_9ACTN|nr:ParB/RepB/Spo0J family partition protein [Streptomyces aidingensis]SFD74111.1 chromosome partitioning protein, ParB family [Streptomyces aidingensis]
MAAQSRNTFDDFFDDDEDTPVVDTKPDGRLLRVPLNRIAANLVNPRENFGTAEELEDLGKSLKRRQIQALPVVTRKAYLKLWPDHADQVGNVDVVIVSGERRYRAAQTVGLPALECVINDDVAKDHSTFLDAVVSENIDRANFDPIEEARAVDALVKAFGTGRAVAQHYERADGWVSQRRILLALAPAVQTMVRRRELPLEPARKLGKLVKDHKWTEEQQLDWWATEQGQRKAAVAQRKAEKKAAAPPHASSGSKGRKPEPSTKAPAAPEPPATDAATPDAIPWDDPAAVVRISKERMTPEDFQTAAKLWQQQAELG